MADWLLVHPPLLGPAVLRPLADELRARGLSVVAPDLRGTVTTAGGWPARGIEAAGARRGGGGRPGGPAGGRPSSASPGPARRCLASPRPWAPAGSCGSTPRCRPAPV